MEETTALVARWFHLFVFFVKGPGKNAYRPWAFPCSEVAVLGGTYFTWRTSPCLRIRWPSLARGPGPLSVPFVSRHLTWQMVHTRGQGLIIGQRPWSVKRLTPAIP